MFRANYQTKLITVLKSILYIGSMQSQKFILIGLFLLSSTLSLNAQLINKDYKEISVIQRDSRNHGDIPFDFFWNKEKNILIVGYDFKPTRFEVYNIETWTRISYFETKGHTDESGSFFSPLETDIIYINKIGGKTLYKINYLTGEELGKTSCKKLEFECPTLLSHKSFYESFTQTKSLYHEYIFFDVFALIIEDNKVIVYKKD